jgi:hypothetical protein
MESSMKPTTTQKDLENLEVLEDLERPVEELTPEQAEAAQGGFFGLYVAAPAVLVGAVVGSVLSSGETDTLRALRK